MNLWKKDIRLPDDISTGYKGGWVFGNNYDPKTHLTPDYAFTFVNKTDGYPVRLGKQSIRFEIRRGDCGVDAGGYNDCTIWNESTGHYSERHELGSNFKFKNKSTTWHTYSFFLPEDFPIEGHGYEHISMGQFHGGPNNNPGFKWDLDEGTYQLRRRTACYLEEFIKESGEEDGFACSVNNRQEFIGNKDLRGQWHDVVVNIKLSIKQNGYFKQWINGKLVYHYLGNTSKPRGSTNQFRMGIYRGATKSTPEVSTQIAYYDEIRFANKSCKKLKLKDLGYSCKELEGQKIGNIDFIPGKLDIEITSSSSMDGKYQLQWYWLLKKIEDDTFKDQWIVLTDYVTISNGRLSFDKLANSDVISDKYRKDINFINWGDNFVIKGNLDLDTSKPEAVKITGPVTQLEDGSYIGEGLHGIDIKKVNKEYIKVIFKPLTGTEAAISTLTKEQRYVKTLTNRISKKIISANSLSEEKTKKVIKWVNKELVKWSKDDGDEINTIEGRKKKIQSLTKKGIKKFK